MSRLLVSDSRTIADAFRLGCVAQGFKESHFEQFDKAFLSSFKKLKVYNENFFASESNYVAICGTLIYKEKIGKESLSLLLNDFIRHGDVAQLRKHTMGNYMICICVDGTITSFCDSRNIYYEYYYSNNGKWCLSNSLYEMASAIGKENITIDENAFLEEMYSRCIWGDETIFKEIKRLEGDSYITIDTSSGILAIHECRVTQQMIEEGFDETVDSFSHEICHICNIVKSVFPTISVAMTGGLDSRSALAGLIAAKNASTSLLANPITLLYGIGNNQLVETRNEDKSIVDCIARRFGLSLSYLDWASPENINQSWDELSKKYGFLGRVYSGSPNVHASLLERDEEFITYGYFGESYSYEDTLMGKYFTLDDFLDYYIGKRSIAIAPNYVQYRNHISEKIKVSLAKKGIDGNKMSVSDWILLELEMRRKKDTVMVNLSNQHRYSFAILGEESLLRYAYCPLNYKKNRRFLLNMINKNCPDLLNVPVFSHMEARTVDKNKLMLTTTLMMHARDILKKNLKNSKLRQLAVTVDKVVRGDKKSREEVGKNDKTVKLLQKLYSGMPYRPHDIFSEASTNHSLEARYVYTLMMLQNFKKQK